jgi:acylphosphatase
MKIRVKVTVKGVVQGVNFRRFTQQKALHFQVNGWVRNLPDGNVEGCFEGDETNVQALIEWCRLGPGSARVGDVLVERAEFTGEFDDFQIAR